jgi:hypothetical protein
VTRPWRRPTARTGLWPWPTGESATLRKRTPFGSDLARFTPRALCPVPRASDDELYEQLSTLQILLRDPGLPRDNLDEGPTRPVYGD